MYRWSPSLTPLPPLSTKNVQPQANGMKELSWEHQSSWSARNSDSRRLAAIFPLQKGKKYHTHHHSSAALWRRIRLWSSQTKRWKHEQDEGRNTRCSGREPERAMQSSLRRVPGNNRVRKKKQRGVLPASTARNMCPNVSTQSLSENPQRTFDGGILPVR